MKRIITLGLILLCLLCSLGAVVGEQSIKSSLEQDSPLFFTRTLRANNQQLDAITPEYLGKGTHNFLNFQTQEDRTEAAEQFLRIIMKIDKKTFERLATQESLKELLFKEFSHTDPQILPTSPYATACGRWVPGCYLKEILSIIIAFIKNGFQWPTYTWFCWHSGQIPCDRDIFNRS